MPLSFAYRIPFLAALTVTLVGQTAPKDPWVEIFDGRSLENWKAAENPDAFRLEDGKLVIRGSRGHLFFTGGGQKAEFENFILEAEVLTKPGANSGLFIHTQWQDAGWPAHGYEVQINNSHGDPIRTGSLYGVVNVADPGLSDDTWFTLRVEVRRRQVITQVDGRELVRFEEPENTTGTRRLSRGTFAIQAHDPDSEVHIRKVRVRPLPSHRGILTRAERQLLKPDGPWWEKMDYGPFLSSTVGVGSKGDHVALKGITIPLDPDGAASVTFDTDLLRMAFGFRGPLKLRGVTYDGAHGGFPFVESTPVFHTRTAPGWAHTGSLDDPRPTPHGPIPDDHGRYRGLFRHGESVVLSYEVDGVPILERPHWVSGANGSGHFVRQLEIGPSDRPLRCVVADTSSFDEVTLDPQALTATAVPPRAVAPVGAQADGPRVMMDRTDGPWSQLAMGTGLGQDSVGPMTARSVSGWAAARGRVEGQQILGLADRQLPKDQDDPGGVVFFDGGPARFHVDLGQATAVTQVDTFSWHVSDRAPQRYVLWGSPAEKCPDASSNLAVAGWTPIASVDTTVLGWGGKHGASVYDTTGNPLGTFRHLLLDLSPVWKDQGCFLGEIKVWSPDHPAPAHGELARLTKSDPLFVHLTPTQGGSASFQHVKDGPTSTLVMDLPPSRTTRRVEIALGTSAVELVPTATGPAFSPLLPLTQGGPALYPEAVVVKGSRSDDQGSPWVVDDIPIPFENPWDSFLRVGAFDFFSDGDRAALCTWNGDVWVVSGLNGDLATVRWRRFATGLFETLGLRIVQDLVYVNGRDQITRLRDLNGDGEADAYDCFNNDVHTTRNFHEFTFDLQTDEAGSFYFSKAAPVRSGGRGFEEIVTHHGTVMKLSADGADLSVYARGMRAPNGIGVSPSGQVTAGDNEGTWVPHCKLHWLSPGSFQGVVDVAPPGERPATYNPPLCWFPMEVDNSSGGQVWVPDERWGPFAGDLLHLSYGQSSIYKVMEQEVGDVMQGGVVRIPVKLGSSAMRGRFHPKDGQLWVCGLKGWQTNAARLSAFQRVRRTQAPVNLPEDLRVTSEGIEITFTCELDAELAKDPESYAVSWWNYVWGPQYGSPEVSADAPDPEVLEKAQTSELQAHKSHDQVTVDGVELKNGGRTVLLRIPGIKPVMQVHIKMDLETEDGIEMPVEIWSTINAIPNSQLKK